MDTTESLLKLRKLTHLLTDSLQAQMAEHLTTLMPLFRPRTVLGDYVQGAGFKEAPKRADRAFQELQSLWASFATSRGFGVDRGLTPPLSVPGGALEFSPLDYSYVATDGSESRTLSVRSPLKWILSYSGFGPGRLLELLLQKDRYSDDLQRCVLHYLILHVVINQQPGLLKVFDQLHFPLSMEHPAEFAGLPIATISCAISTRRPPDKVIVQSAALTGVNAFEEVVVVQDIERLADPLKERMLDVVRTIDRNLLTAKI